MLVLHDDAILSHTRAYTILNTRSSKTDEILEGKLLLLRHLLRRRPIVNTHVQWLPVEHDVKARKSNFSAPMFFILAVSQVLNVRQLRISRAKQRREQSVVILVSCVPNSHIVSRGAGVKEVSCFSHSNAEATVCVNNLQQMP